MKSVIIPELALVRSSNLKVLMVLYIHDESLKNTG